MRPHFSIPLYPCRRIFTFFDLSNFFLLQTKEKINRFEDRIDTRYTKEREEDIFFIIFLETISMERLIRSNSASLSNRQLLVPRSFNFACWSHACSLFLSIHLQKDEKGKKKKAAFTNRKWRDRGGRSGHIRAC